MPAFPLIFLNSAAINLPVSFVQTIQQFAVLALCLTYATECKPDYNTKAYQIPAATNITLILVSWFPPAIKVQWQLNQSEVLNVKEMQIFYNPVKSSVRSMIKVTPDVRQVTLNKLQPNQEYELELLSVSTNSMLTNSSSIVNFISPSNESSPISKFSYYTPYSQEEIRRKLRITMDEIVILIIVLCVWLTVICIFCSKWSKLRHLEPYHPDYRPSSLGSTTQHSPAYSVDSDNLANVGALTTTPVASGMGELTDEDDDGLLIGTSVVNNPLANIQPCSGIHSTAPLFAHSNCAHTLDVHATNVCTSVLITDPLAVTTSNTVNYYGSDDVKDINIPVPINHSINQSQTINHPINQAIRSDDLSNRQNYVNQVKKQVQFQNIHHPTHTAYFAQFTPNQFTQTNQDSAASFVLPVSMATPHLGDIYCHGTAIAYNTNYSSIDSTASFNSNSCTSCSQIYGNAYSTNRCPSLAEQSSLQSVEQPIYSTSNLNTDHSSTGSSSLKQQSVESIYIELPTQYHIRSNSTPSEDVSSNVNTVIHNSNHQTLLDPSVIKQHSPLTEECNLNDSVSTDAQFSGEQACRGKSSKNEETIISESNESKRLKKSKSDEQMRQSVKNMGTIKKYGSLDWMVDVNMKRVENCKKAQSSVNSGKDNKLNSNSRSKKRKHHYHSIDNVSSIASLPHNSLIQRFHSSNGLKQNIRQIRSNQSNVNQSSQQINSKTILRPLNNSEISMLKHKKRKGHPFTDLMHRDHHRSDNLIVKNRPVKLRDLNEQSSSSLTQQQHPFKKFHRSFTESETTNTSFTPSSSNSINKRSNDLDDRIERRVQMKTRSKSLNNSTDYGSITTDRSSSEKKRTSDHYARMVDCQDDRTIQDSDIFEFEQSDESLFDRPPPINRLNSIQEDLVRTDTELDDCDNKLDSEQATYSLINQKMIRTKQMHPSATMYNMSTTMNYSNNDEYILNRDRPLIGEMRRHQSAEQMLKRIVERIHQLYRNQFKS